MSNRDNFPSGLVAFLPAETRKAWIEVAAVVPDGAYLVGGTAITVHLEHRISRDLDFFTPAPFDPEALDAALRKAGEFEVTLIDDGTLNGMFGPTKVQFLDASSQHTIEKPVTVAGVEVAQVPDLLATKLKVIGDRGELRDYFDIQCIERETPFRAEQGIAFYIERYRPRPPEPSIAHIVEGLGYFGDVADDPSLPESRESIERYWRRRQPQIVASLAKFGVPSPSTG